VAGAAALTQTLQRIAPAVQQVVVQLQRGVVQEDDGHLRGAKVLGPTVGAHERTEAQRQLRPRRLLRCYTQMTLLGVRRTRLVRGLVTSARTQRRACRAVPAAVRPSRPAQGGGVRQQRQVLHEHMLDLRLQRPSLGSAPTETLRNPRTTATHLCHVLRPHPVPTTSEVLVPAGPRALLGCGRAGGRGGGLACRRRCCAAGSAMQPGKDTRQRDLRDTGAKRVKLASASCLRSAAQAVWATHLHSQQCPYTTPECRGDRPAPMAGG
jgi:hypothetical protein